jgi:hypothetical protein
MFHTLIRRAEKTMSDSRFHLKVEFSIYGRDFKWNPSLNWYGGDERIDSRIIDWFESCYAEAYAEYREGIQDDLEREERQRIEAEERAQLAKLKAKYEGGAA